MNEKIDDFIRGQRDCRDGVEHRSGQSEDYDRGYSVQYALEQQQTAAAEIAEEITHGK